jgi:dipeptidyl-peptidase-4
MNRLQNELEFLLADIQGQSEGEIQPNRCYYEKSETYIEINDNLIFLTDNEHFLWNSEKDGWNHIYLYNLDGSEIAQLTKGEWEVVSFYGTNQKRKEVYFSAAIENSISEEIYSLGYEKFLKKGSDAEPDEDSRKLLSKLTPNGKTNTAVFSDTYDYFINFASSASEPQVITLRTHTGKVIRTLEDNSVLAERLDKLSLSPKEFGVIENREGVELNYWMIKPPNFDASNEYPLMFMIYGGPGSNTVTNEWGGATYFWHQMLAQEGYVIVSVDPRGTMRKGRDFKHSTYLQLGKNETEDFIDAAKHFGNLNFIDSDRIGMMGWSYGGYMSSLCMTKGAEYFKLGIAVAPVTNWRFYDTIYTERFMRTPQENPDGYDDNSPINHVDKLKGHYLLVHGSADDNVHLQNTMEMVKALVEADKQFDLFVYPNKNHGIYGGNTRYHLFTKMTNFIKENL